MPTKSKKNLSATAIRRMRRVIAAVLAEPQFYNQMVFPKSYDCGATCCGAGWAVWLKDPAKYLELVKTVADWPTLASAALGIGDSGTKLFYSPGLWPYKFARKYNNAITPLGRAQAMAARWEHFIATDGAQ